jgi:hypothetical protein
MRLAAGSLSELSRSMPKAEIRFPEKRIRKVERVFAFCGIELSRAWDSHESS